MKTPIQKLRQKYRSADEHLKAIVDAIVEQFAIPQDQHADVRLAVSTAFHVGHSTTTTDDWCNS